MIGVGEGIAIFGVCGTITAAIVKLAPGRRNNNGGGHTKCLHGDSVTMLVAKFEGFEKTLGDFIARNDKTNDEQYSKINDNSRQLAAMGGTVEILKRKVLNGG
ncbi:MAG: hypothetical protein FVQ81_02145 [Candidatus Glassbacteria bacterium]|nr:hypothetical protein [Candidatus Glassbacteria bacterium]